MKQNFKLQKENGILIDPQIDACQLANEILHFGGLMRFDPEEYDYKRDYHLRQAGDARLLLRHRNQLQDTKR